MISWKRLKLLGLAALLLGAGWIAVDEIQDRGALASKQLAMAAREAIERGEHDLAMLLALEGVPAGKGQFLHMDSLQARFVLNEARLKISSSGGSQTLPKVKVAEGPLWKTDTYDQPWILKGREHWRDHSDFSKVDASGEIATSLDQDGNLILLYLPSFEQLTSLSLFDQTEGSVQFSSDGRSVIVFLDSRTELVYNLGADRKLEGNADIARSSIHHDSYFFNKAAFVDERTIVLFEECFDEFHIWDLESNTLETKTFHDKELIHCSENQRVLIRSDGVEDDETDVFVYNLASRESLRLEEPEEDWFLFHDELIFSMYGRWIVVRSETPIVDSGNLVVWSRESGKLVANLRLAEMTELLFFGSDGYVAYEPKSTNLVVGKFSSNEQPENRKIESGLKSVLYVNQTGSHIIFSRSDHSLVHFDLERNEVLQEFVGHSDTIHAAVVGEEKDVLITSSADGTARVWDLLSGEMIHTLDGHENARGSVLMYDIETDGFREYIIEYLQDSPWRIRWLGDGTILLGEPAALGVEVWDISHDNEMIAEACASLPQGRRNLTPEENSRYGFRPRKKGPCERLGPLSPDFWREKAESPGFLQ